MDSPVQRIRFDDKAQEKIDKREGDTFNEVKHARTFKKFCQLRREGEWDSGLNSMSVPSTSSHFSSLLSTNRNLSVVLSMLVALYTIISLDLRIQKAGLEFAIAAAVVPPVVYTYNHTYYVSQYTKVCPTSSPTTYAGLTYAQATDLCKTFASAPADGGNTAGDWFIASFPTRESHVGFASIAHNGSIGGISGTTTSVWYGADDIAVEDQWKWSSGRLAGKKFYQGQTSYGNCVGVTYAPTLADYGAIAGAPTGAPLPSFPAFQSCFLSSEWGLDNGGTQDQDCLRWWPSSQIVEDLQCSFTQNCVACERSICNLQADCHGSGKISVTGFWPNCKCQCTGGRWGTFCQFPVVVTSPAYTAEYAVECSSPKVGFSDAANVCSSKLGSEWFPATFPTTNNFQNFRDVVRLTSRFNTWVGADDSAVEGDWRWSNGRLMGSVWYRKSAGCQTYSYTTAALSKTFANGDIAFSSYTFSSCTNFWQIGSPDTASQDYASMNPNSEMQLDDSTGSTTMCVACERDPCNIPTDCVGGPNTNTVSGYWPACTCNCNDGYSGTICETRVCHKNVDCVGSNTYAVSGGTYVLTSPNGGCKCQCLKGYGGQRCQRLLTATVSLTTTITPTLTQSASTSRSALSASSTQSSSATETATSSHTAPSASSTQSSTVSGTATSSHTATPELSETGPSISETRSGETVSETFSIQPTNTPVETESFTPSASQSLSPTKTKEITETGTPSLSISVVPIETRTQSATLAPTDSKRTFSDSFTGTKLPSRSNMTLSASFSQSSSLIASKTADQTLTNKTLSASQTSTISKTHEQTKSQFTFSASESSTVFHSNATETHEKTNTPTASQSPVASPSLTEKSTLTEPLTPTEKIPFITRTDTETPNGTESRNDTSFSQSFSRRSKSDSHSETFSDFTYNLSSTTSLTPYSQEVSNTSSVTKSAETRSQLQSPSQTESPSRTLSVSGKTNSPSGSFDETASHSVQRTPSVKLQPSPTKSETMTRDGSPTMTQTLKRHHSPTETITHIDSSTRTETIERDATLTTSKSLSPPLINTAPPYPTDIPPVIEIPPEPIVNDCPTATLTLVDDATQTVVMGKREEAEIAMKELRKQQVNSSSNTTSGGNATTTTPPLTVSETGATDKMIRDGTLLIVITLTSTNVSFIKAQLNLDIANGGGGGEGSSGAMSDPRSLPSLFDLRKMQCQLGSWEFVSVVASATTANGTFPPMVTLAAANASSSSYSFPPGSYSYNATRRFYCKFPPTPLYTLSSTERLSVFVPTAASTRICPQSQWLVDSFTITPTETNVIGEALSAAMTIVMTVVTTVMMVIGDGTATEMQAMVLMLTNPMAPLSDIDSANVVRHFLSPMYGSSRAEYVLLVNLAIMVGFSALHYVFFWLVFRQRVQKGLRKLQRLRRRELLRVKREARKRLRSVLDERNRRMILASPLNSGGVSGVFSRGGNGFSLDLLSNRNAAATTSFGRGGGLGKLGNSGVLGFSGLLSPNHSGVLLFQQQQNGISGGGGGGGGGGVLLSPSQQPTSPQHGTLFLSSPTRPRENSSSACIAKTTTTAALSPASPALFASAAAAVTTPTAVTALTIEQIRARYRLLCSLTEKERLQREAERIDSCRRWAEANCVTIEIIDDDDDEASNFDDDDDDGGNSSSQRRRQHRAGKRKGKRTETVAVTATLGNSNIEDDDDEGDLDFLSSVSPAAANLSPAVVGLSSPSANQNNNINMALGSSGIGELSSFEIMTLGTSGKVNNHHRQPDDRLNSPNNDEHSAVSSGTTCTGVGGGSTAATFNHGRDASLRQAHHLDHENESDDDDGSDGAVSGDEDGDATNPKYADMPPINPKTDLEAQAIIAICKRSAAVYTLFPSLSIVIVQILYMGLVAAVLAIVRDFVEVTRRVGDGGASSSGLDVGDGGSYNPFASSSASTSSSSYSTNTNDNSQRQKDELSAELVAFYANAIPPTSFISFTRDTTSDMSPTQVQSRLAIAVVGIFIAILVPFLFVFVVMVAKKPLRFSDGIHFKYYQWGGDALSKWWGRRLAASRSRSRSRSRSQGASDEEGDDDGFGENDGNFDDDDIFDDYDDDDFDAENQNNQQRNIAQKRREETTLAANNNNDRKKRRHFVDDDDLDDDDDEDFAAVDASISRQSSFTVSNTHNNQRMNLISPDGGGGVGRIKNNPNNAIAPTTGGGGGGGIGSSAAALPTTATTGSQCGVSGETEEGEGDGGGGDDEEGALRRGSVLSFAASSRAFFFENIKKRKETLKQIDEEKKKKQLGEENNAAITVIQGEQQKGIRVKTSSPSGNKKKNKSKKRKKRAETPSFFMSLFFPTVTPDRRRRGRKRQQHDDDDDDDDNYQREEEVKKNRSFRFSPANAVPPPRPFWLHQRERQVWGAYEQRVLSEIERDEMRRGVWGGDIASRGGGGLFAFSHSTSRGSVASAAANNNNNNGMRNRGQTPQPAAATATTMNAKNNRNQAILSRIPPPVDAVAAIEVAVSGGATAAVPTTISATSANAIFNRQRLLQKLIGWTSKRGIQSRGGNCPQHVTTTMRTTPHGLTKAVSMMFFIDNPTLFPVTADSTAAATSTKVRSRSTVPSSFSSSSQHSPMFVYFFGSIVDTLFYIPTTNIESTAASSSSTNAPPLIGANNDAAATAGGAMTTDRHGDGPAVDANANNTAANYNFSMLLSRDQREGRVPGLLDTFPLTASSPILASIARLALPSGRWLPQQRTATIGALIANLSPSMASYWSTTIPFILSTLFGVIFIIGPVWKEAEAVYTLCAMLCIITIVSIVVVAPFRSTLTVVITVLSFLSLAMMAISHVLILNFGLITSGDGSVGVGGAGGRATALSSLISTASSASSSSDQYYYESGKNALVMFKSSSSASSSSGGSASAKQITIGGGASGGGDGSNVDNADDDGNMIKIPPTWPTTLKTIFTFSTIILVLLRTVHIMFLGAVDTWIWGKHHHDNNIRKRCDEKGGRKQVKAKSKASPSDLSSTGGADRSLTKGGVENIVDVNKNFNSSGVMADRNTPSSLPTCKHCRGRIVVKRELPSSPSTAAVIIHDPLIFLSPSNAHDNMMMNMYPRQTNNNNSPHNQSAEISDGIEQEGGEGKPSNKVKMIEGGGGGGGGSGDHNNDTTSAFFVSFSPQDENALVPLMNANAVLGEKAIVIGDGNNGNQQPFDSRSQQQQHTQRVASKQQNIAPSAQAMTGRAMVMSQKPTEENRNKNNPNHQQHHHNQHQHPPVTDSNPTASANPPSTTSARTALSSQNTNVGVVVMMRGDATTAPPIGSGGCAIKRTQSKNILGENAVYSSASSSSSCYTSSDEDIEDNNGNKKLPHENANDINNNAAKTAARQSRRRGSVRTVAPLFSSNNNESAQNDESNMHASSPPPLTTFSVSPAVAASKDGALMKPSVVTHGNGASSNINQLTNGFEIPANGNNTGNNASYASPTPQTNGNKDCDDDEEEDEDSPLLLLPPSPATSIVVPITMIPYVDGLFASTDTFASDIIFAIFAAIRQCFASITDGINTICCCCLWKRNTRNSEKNADAKDTEKDEEKEFQQPTNDCDRICTCLVGDGGQQNYNNPPPPQQQPPRETGHADDMPSSVALIEGHSQPAAAQQQHDNSNNIGAPSAKMTSTMMATQPQQQQCQTIDLRIGRICTTPSPQQQPFSLFPATPAAIPLNNADDESTSNEHSGVFDVGVGNNHHNNASLFLPPPNNKPRFGGCGFNNVDAMLHNYHNRHDDDNSDDGIPIESVISAPLELPPPPTIDSGDIINSEEWNRKNANENDFVLTLNGASTESILQQQQLKRNDGEKTITANDPNRIMSLSSNAFRTALDGSSSDHQHSPQQEETRRNNNNNRNSISHAVDRKNNHSVFATATANYYNSKKNDNAGRRWSGSGSPPFKVSPPPAAEAIINFGSPLNGRGDLSIASTPNLMVSKGGGNGQGFAGGDKRTSLMMMAAASATRNGKNPPPATASAPFEIPPLSLSDSQEGQEGEKFDGVARGGGGGECTNINNTSGLRLSVSRSSRRHSGVAVVDPSTGEVVIVSSVVMGASSQSPHMLASSMQQQQHLKPAVATSAAPKSKMSNSSVNGNSNPIISIPLSSASNPAVNVMSKSGSPTTTGKVISNGPSPTTLVGKGSGPFSSAVAAHRMLKRKIELHHQQRQQEQKQRAAAVQQQRQEKLMSFIEQKRAGTKKAEENKMQEQTSAAQPPWLKSRDNNNNNDFEEDGETNNHDAQPQHPHPLINRRGTVAPVPQTPPFVDSNEKRVPAVEKEADEDFHSIADSVSSSHGDHEEENILDSVFGGVSASRKKRSTKPATDTRKNDIGKRQRRRQFVQGDDDDFGGSSGEEMVFDDDDDDFDNAIASVARNINRTNNRKN